MRARIGHHAQGELYAEHAFASHHADLQGGLAIDLGQQGNEAVDGKIYVSRSFSGLAQHVGEDKVERLANGEQAQAFIARKKRDDMILGVGKGVPDAKAEHFPSLTAF